MLIPFIASPALAFALNGRVWPEDQLPIEVHWSGTQPGFTQDELRTIMDAAGAAWTEAGPCTFGFAVVEDPDAYGWFDDGGVAVLFGDPYDEIQGGVGAAWKGLSSDPHDRSMYLLVSDEDLWILDENIDAGGCSNQYSLLSVVTRELGYVLGLDDPCPWGDCEDPRERDATMSLGEACDTSRSTLNSDDVAGISALYGEVFSFSCSAHPDDGLTVQCAILTPADADSLAPTWDFGDGATATGSATSYTYATPGDYDIQLCMLPTGCSDVRCQIYSFMAAPVIQVVTPIAEAPDAPSSNRCGCAADASGPSALGLPAWAVLGVALSRARRRRGSRS